MKLRIDKMQHPQARLIPLEIWNHGPFFSNNIIDSAFELMQILRTEFTKIKKPRYHIKEFKLTSVLDKEVNLLASQHERAL